MSGRTDKATKRGSVLIVGGGIGGMQAALDLGDSGFKVHLVQKESSIGGIMSALDKTFPTGDCAMCMISPKMVDIGRHMNIEIHSCSELVELEGVPGDFKATILKKARYVDLKKCTGCEACIAKCPVEASSEFNQDLAVRTAINRRYPQAVPGAVAIDKLGVSPCRIQCPAEVNAHAYVTLTARGRYAEALEVVRRNNPFPASTGRVCNHPCETGCRRNELDEAVSICSLKRFLTDWETEHGGFVKPVLPEEKLEKVAVVGGGPAGMTCARDLALKGYRVTVFEKMPKAGGMLTYAIPGYRLPDEVVQRELDTIIAHDIDMKYNHELGRDFTVDGLKAQGYGAVFIAVGTQRAMTIPVEGETRPSGIYDCLEFLRMANTGERAEMGEKVIVIGGGNVAVDAALTAGRMGAKEVRMVCLEKCDEMPAHKWELEQVAEEGVIVENSWGTDRVCVEDGRVTGLDVKRCVSVFDDNKRFNPSFDACELNHFEADTIIFAIGMAVDKAFAKGVEGLDLLPNGRIKANPVTYMTNLEGVFAGGDAVLGPSTVIQAIATGSQAAESIDRLLRGRDLFEDRKKITERDEYLKDLKGVKKTRRMAMRMLPVGEREGNFSEVALGFSEEEALQEAGRCMSCAGCCECYLCVAECQAKAIDHEMSAEVYEDIDVGAVIMAPGLDLYNAKVRGELGLGRWPNVVTSLQFERILSASGPYQGTVTRPGDGRHPVRIAWIQCVGSRDGHNANPWCSSVCCMYATKQAVIAREHDKSIEPTIFFMDMRAYGKDFDKYVERAKNEYGVRYLRAMVSAVREEPGTGNLVLRYALEDGALMNEKFDLVVLSVGLEPHKDVNKLAEICGFELNDHRFPKTGCFSPVDSTQPGVFVTGIFQSPKDIPETVVQGSAVAGQVMALLGEARWTETVKKELPPERDVSEEEPRIGVFICSCGINIAGTVDVARVVEAVKDLPNVEHAENTLYTCSQDSQEKIKQVIAEKGLNRLLVASCTPRTHTPLFQETLEEAGLNKYLFELADIREQCSWCHMGDREAATKKAITLVKMMLGKVRLLQPVKVETVGVTPACLIVGGGVAGMTAALAIAGQGFNVHLIEKERELGGLARNVYVMPDGSNVKRFVNGRISEVMSNPRITVHTGVEVDNTDGFIGNFKTILTDGSEIEHGVVILATGGVEYRPTEYLYNENEHVVTQRELEKKLVEGLQPAHGENYVMIQCVGSREEPNQYCSRICCQDAVKNAIEIKERNPQAGVFILYRDIRTYGLREDYYTKARSLGVVFVRYEVDRKPQVEEAGRKLLVRTWDYILDREIELDADWLVLSTGLRPHPLTDKVGTTYKVTRNADGYFLEAHVKLRPVDFAGDGLFVAGLAHAPKNLDETISHALAAAGRAGVTLSHERLAVSGIIARQKRELCMSCLSCMRICPFGSPFIDEDGKISHNEIKCHGCGLCAGVCPAKAFQVNGFRDDQMIAMVDAAMDYDEGGIIS
jgi:heterodisulfide reductase subunit A-like polyferredoxin